MGRRELRDLAVNVYHGPGDALAGDQIIAQARSVSRPTVVPGTSTHRVQEVVLKKNALCVIDRPFRLVERPLKLTIE